MATHTQLPIYKVAYDLLDGEPLFETANSYFGLLGQASHSHHDRTMLANALRKRGQSISLDITKTFRRRA